MAKTLCQRFLLVEQVSLVQSHAEFKMSFRRQLGVPGRTFVHMTYKLGVSDKDPETAPHINK